MCNLEGYCGISTSTLGEMTKRKAFVFQLTHVLSSGKLIMLNNCDLKTD